MDKIAIKPNLHAITLPAIDRITDYARPLLWLRKGWSDMQRTPLLSLGFGALFAALGLRAGAFWMGRGADGDDADQRIPADCAVPGRGVL